MAQPQVINNQNILLRIPNNSLSESNDEQLQEHAIDIAHKAAEKAWEPKSCGKCGRNLWSYYCLGCCSCICSGLSMNQENPNAAPQRTGGLTRCCDLCCGSDNEDGFDDPYCCDSTHLTMHLFFLLLITSIGFLISGSVSSPNVNAFTSELKDWILHSFIPGSIISILVVLFAFAQINRILRARMRAGKLLDEIEGLDAETKKFVIGVATTKHLKERVMDAEERRSNTVNDLRKKFKDLKVITDGGLIISDQNNKLGLLLVTKFMRIQDKLEAALIESEKAIIEAIYEGLQFKDGKKGLDQEEFEEFVHKLGGGYREKFRLQLNNFEQWAGDDGIFDRKELFTLLDMVSREQALEVDEDE